MEDDQVNMILEEEKLEYDRNSVKMWNLKLLEKKVLNIDDISETTNLRHIQFLEKSAKKKQNKKEIWDDRSIKGNIIKTEPAVYLVVEDNVFARVNIISQIKKINRDIKVDVAADGYEAFSKFKTLICKGFSYCSILMDIYLPNLRGDAATEMIRELKLYYLSRCQIIAVSCESADGIKNFVNFDGYIEKPTRYEGLRSVLNNKLY